MSRRKIQTLRKDSIKWAYLISKICIVVGALCFVGFAVLSESLRIWPARVFVAAFMFDLLAWVTHYAFIVLDEFIHRQYWVAFFMSVVIAGFGWVVQSCVRWIISYR